MSAYIIKRVIEVANHIINTKDTIRETAKKFCISKSTVHKDLQERLSQIDVIKYNIVKEILNEHIETRHIKGGESTRQLFLKKNKLHYKKL